MKNLMNLVGAQKLSRNEQQSINGGHNCTNCPSQCTCRAGVCDGFDPICGSGWGG